MRRNGHDTMLRAYSFIFGGLAGIAMLGALISLLVAVLLFGRQVLDWLKTGAWSTATIGEAWPATAEFVSDTEWIGLQRIEAWVISLPEALAYAAIALAAWLIGAFLIGARELVEDERIKDFPHDQHDVPVYEDWQ